MLPSNHRKRSPSKGLCYYCGRFGGLCFCLAVLCSLLAYICYRGALGFGINKAGVTLSIFSRLTVCLLLMMVATTVSLFCCMRWVHTIIALVFQLLMFYLIFILDQGILTAKSKTDYGYFSSRGIIYAFVAFEAVIISVIMGIRFFIQCPLLMAIKGCVASFLALLLFFYLPLVYLNRRNRFRKGSIGDSYLDLTQSKCHFNTDVLGLAHYIPRHLAHMFMSSYWCSVTHEFVEVVESDINSKETTVRIDCPTSKTLEIFLYNNVMDHYTYQMLGQNFEYKTTSALSKRVFANFHKNTSAPESAKVGMHLSLPNDERYTEYTYDGVKYQTTVLKCGKDKNVVTNLRKRVPDDLIYDLSPERPNVINIFFDGMSRKTYDKFMRRTLSFVNDVHREMKDKIRVIEYLQHHTVISLTSNTIYMYTGTYRTPYTRDKQPYWADIQANPKKNKKGYLTANSDDECGEWSSLWIGEIFFHNYVQLEPFCMPEYDPGEHTLYGTFKGPYSASRRCLYQNEAPSYVFEFAKQVEYLYPNKAKLLNLFFADSHEVTTESGSYVDHFLEEYLYFLKERNVLEKSIIFLYADHGNAQHFMRRWPFNRITNEATWGRGNPPLIILVPKGYKLLDEEIAKVNTQRVVSALDLYKTWSNILGNVPDVNRKGKLSFNILNEEVPFNRTCEDINTAEGYCFLVCDVPY